MARIHRGQLFVRGGWRDGARTLHAVAGYAQVDADAEQHVVTGYAAQRMPDGVLLTGTTHREDIEADDGYVAAGEVDRLITGTRWPRPGGDLAGGGLVLRRTRIPAPEGQATMIVAGLFSSDGALLDDQHTASIGGTVGGTLVIDGWRCVRHWNTNGSTLSQVLKSRRWGWGEEPWGAVSTMDLASIDEAMALETLLADPDAEQAEIDRLRRTPGGGARCGGEADEKYQRFRRQMVDKAGPLRWDGVLSRSEGERRDRIAERIVRDMMQAA